MSIKKKNKYAVVIQPLTYNGVEYKVYIKIRKTITLPRPHGERHPQAGLYAFRAHKKIMSYLRQNHLTMKFYDITMFSVSV